ncbi:MAG: hypothetical protein IJP62_04350 [Treponema sp.]|nr:hypothetical protein [Treponema sp.]
MFDLFLAELLILLMIFSVSVRIFFTKNARIDATAILAPVSFIFSLLIFYIWGIDPVILLLCILSLFTFLINARSLARLSARLVVDYYNIRFVIPSILIALISLGILVILIIFHPVRYLPQDFGVKRSKTLLTGNLTSGYQVRKTLFEKSKITGTLYEYAQETEDDTTMQSEPKSVILFVPKCTANVTNYEPYFLLLAQKGYRIITADFYASQPARYGNVLDTRFFRRSCSMFLSLFRKDDFAAINDADVKIAMMGYNALSRLALAQYGSETKLFFIVDGISIDLLNELTAQFPENAMGFFAINRVAEYQTSGYGFLEQTDPLAAYFFNLKRDSSFFIPRYVAGKTTESIEQTKKLAAPVEIIKTATEPVEATQES